MNGIHPKNVRLLKGVILFHVFLLSTFFPCCVPKHVLCSNCSQDVPKTKLWTKNWRRSQAITTIYAALIKDREPPILGNQSLAVSIQSGSFMILLVVSCDDLWQSNLLLLVVAVAGTTPTPGVGGVGTSDTGTDTAAAAAAASTVVRFSFSLCTPSWMSSSSSLKRSCVVV